MHALDLSHEARFLQPRIEQWLLECNDLVAAREVGTIERDEMAVPGEWGSKRFATTLVPAIHQL